MNRRFFTLLAFAAPLALAPPALADWPNNAATHVPVAVGPGDASVPVVVPDGAGGVLVVWSDNRSGNSDVYAQRLGAGGAPLWGMNGILLFGGGGNQDNVIGASDGAGGVVLAYADNAVGLGADVRMGHLFPDGSTLGYSPYLWQGYGDQFPNGIARTSNGNFCIALRDNYWGHWNIAAAILTPSGGSYGLQDICLEAEDQLGTTIVADDVGGAYLVWQDLRPGPTGNNIYAQHMGPTGTLAWPANGLQVSNTGYGNFGYTGVSDGAGGFVAIWNDFDGVAVDLMANHVVATYIPNPSEAFWLAPSTNHARVTGVVPDGEGGFIATWEEIQTGSPYNSWGRVGRFTSSGVQRWSPLTLGVNNSANSPQIAGDGEGGVFVGWREYLTSGPSDLDVFVNHVNADGALLGPWQNVPLCHVYEQQNSPTLCSDGRGGAIAVWQDARQYLAGNSWDLYAGRIAPFAKLGNPEPDIVSVTDVMNDQGGRVSVRWNRSYLDKATSQQLSSYWMWREIPAAAALAALADGATRFAAPAPTGERGGEAAAAGTRPAPAEGAHLIREVAAGAWAGYWEYVGQQSAQGFTSYAMTVATTGDSVPGSNPPTRFMVEALAYNWHWESEPAGGYSVDNLAPAPPAPFAAVFGGASTALHWAANDESDLTGYRLYRGATPGFVPDGASFVAEVSDTNYVDGVALPYWYKLEAVDTHGNASPAALAAASGLLDAGGVTPAALSFAGPSPNPARGPVTLRFALPAAGAVRLVIHDAQGRRVTTLADGAREAGQHALVWDRRDESGARVAPGLYFARLHAGARELTERFVSLD